MPPDSIARRSLLALPRAPFGRPRAFPICCGGPLAILTFLITTFLALLPEGFRVSLDPLAISLALSAALISARRLLGGFFRAVFLTLASAIPVLLALDSVGRKGASGPPGSIEASLNIAALDFALALPPEGGRGVRGPCDTPVSTSLRASLGYLVLEAEPALTTAAAALAERKPFVAYLLLSLTTAGCSLGYLIVEAEACLMDSATEGSLEFDLTLGLTCEGSPLGYLTVSREAFLARALPRPSAIIIGIGIASDSGMAASGCSIPVVHGMLLALALTLLERGLLVVLGVPMSNVSAAAVGTVGIARGAPPKPGGGGCGGSPTRFTIIALGSLFLLSMIFLVILEAPPDGGGPGGDPPE